MKSWYKYELWYCGSCVSESEYEYESESEAQQEAKNQIRDIIDYWKKEKSYEGEMPDDFEIKIKEKVLEL